MASLWYFFAARDNSTSGQGTRLTGLHPTWTMFRRLEDNNNVTPTPTVVEVGFGLYKFAYDSESSGDAVGQVDLLGGGNPNNVTLTPGDQYVDVWATRESSRVMIGLAGERLATDPTGASTLAALERWYATEADEDQ